MSMVLMCTISGSSLGKKEIRDGVKALGQYKAWYLLVPRLLCLMRVGRAWEVAVQGGFRCCPLRGCVLGKMRQCGAWVIAACCITHRNAMQLPMQRAAFGVHSFCRLLCACFLGG